MNQPRTEPAIMNADDVSDEFELQEKDHGDTVVYDIYRKGNYLMTLDNAGSILFMNFKAAHLNQVIEKVVDCFMKKVMLA